MKSNIIPFHLPQKPAFSDPAVSEAPHPEPDSNAPLSPLAELVWDSHYFLNELLFSVLEQLEILEAAEWFRGRGDGLNRHRAANMDAASARRAPSITAAWLETKSALEQLQAAILQCLGGRSGFENEKAAIKGWNARKPAGEFLKLCERVQTAIEAARGPQPVSAAVALKDSGETAALRANPGRYGSDLKFLGQLREVCMPAA